MNVQCPRCGKVLAVPPDKAHQTGLSALCADCGAVFSMDVASLADASPPASPEAGPAPRADPTPGAPPPPPAAVVPPEERPRPPVPWRHCSHHPKTRSEEVCSACGKGWCRECATRVQGAVLCPSCQGRCVSFEERERADASARMRGRPLFEEIGTIARYPLVDPRAFVLLSTVVGLLGVLSGLSGYALLVSQGLLMAYAFTAVMRTASGRLQGYVPETLALGDLAVPLRLGFAAFVASAWPLILLALLYPHARLLGAPPEGAEPTGAGVASLLALGHLWRLVYSPVALIVAAVSRSVVETLNPLVGFGAILRMGPMYVQAMTVYAAIALGQTVLDLPLFYLPVAGGFLAGFVDSYASLCIGCALGLAVFKRAPELDL